MNNKPTTLRESPVDKIIKIMRSGELAGSFAGGCDCEKCDKYEKKIRAKIKKVLIFYNEELIKKIEGIEVNLQAGNLEHENFAKGVEWFRNKVIKIINQNK